MVLTVADAFWFGSLPLNGCPLRRARCACRHKQERKFPCPFCGKRFAFKDGLERHFLVHPPYECPMCARVFSTAAELQVWRLVGEDARLVALPATGRRRGEMGRESGVEKVALFSPCVQAPCCRENYVGGQLTHPAGIAA